MRRNVGGARRRHGPDVLVAVILSTAGCESTPPPEPENKPPEPAGANPDQELVKIRPAR